MASEREWIDVQLGEKERTELEKRVLVFGWPSDGVGVWMLRFASENELPKDFGNGDFYGREGQSNEGIWSYIL